MPPKKIGRNCFERDPSPLQLYTEQADTRQSPRARERGRFTMPNALTPARRNRPSVATLSLAVGGMKKSGRQGHINKTPHVESGPGATFLEPLTPEDHSKATRTCSAAFIAHSIKAPRMLARGTEIYIYLFQTPAFVVAPFNTARLTPPSQSR